MRDSTSTLTLTIGCLLHDIEELIKRGKKHKDDCNKWFSSYTDNIELLRCVRCHNKTTLLHSDIPNDSIAYIACLANYIAGGKYEQDSGVTDRPHNSSAPLRSIFNRLNGSTLNYCYQLKRLDENTPYPTDVPDNIDNARKQYNEILHELENYFKTIDFNEPCINSLLAVLEDFLSFVPSDTSSDEAADISMYDHVKITAAIGASIYEYLLESNVTDFKTALYDNECEFLDKQVFLMVSCDFSGIQQFLYNIVTDGALKSLRSRSFILQMLMEHCVNEILLGCGLSRVNLIYSGGGHCYILLPNTQKTTIFLEQFKISLNKWLRHQFGTGLYMATSWRTCSANDLMNRPASDAPYKKIFQDLNCIFQRMRVKIIYDAGRDEDAVKPFVIKSNILSYLLDIGNSRLKFMNFAHYVEALVAYHRYLGGKD